ncbi:hypothetical protein C8Q74DRAFT_953270 [Fomes fomentarius]|nr:hypothetical protein C8Q74DRAFT_953270 [Fomes fomentarius]
MSGWLFHPTRPPDRFWGPGGPPQGLRCASRAHSPQTPPTFKPHTLWAPSRRIPLAAISDKLARPSRPRGEGRGMRQTRGRRWHKGLLDSNPELHLTIDECGGPPLWQRSGLGGSSDGMSENCFLHDQRVRMCTRRSSAPIG